jgi:hypothetical protein
MLSRRFFLAASGAAAWARVSTAPRIQAFSIDFNWRRPRLPGWINDFARPGHWADASPAGHVEWYAQAGVNAIQTFCVSCNGNAWYKGGFVPAQPGLRHDFLPEMVRLGHQRNMQVVGYFCAGANTRWGQLHPDLSYGTPTTPHIPLAGPYVDYLCRSIEDCIGRTGIDGYMLDWLWNPAPKLRQAGWLACERKLYEELTGKPFPASGQPAADNLLVYERAALARCWQRIREVTKRANPNCLIFLSCSRLKDPTIASSIALRETDWLLNEGPDPQLYDAAREMTGPQTRLVQGVVGWPKHDAAAWFNDPRAKTLDVYGFAEPGDNSLPLPVAEYLSKPPSAFSGTDAKSVNHRNIATMIRYYRGLAPGAVIPKKG